MDEWLTMQEAAPVLGGVSWSWSWHGSRDAKARES